MSETRMTDEELLSAWCGQTPEDVYTEPAAPSGEAKTCRGCGKTPCIDTSPGEVDPDYGLDAAPTPSPAQAPTREAERLGEQTGICDCGRPLFHVLNEQGLNLTTHTPDDGEWHEAFYTSAAVRAVVAELAKVREELAEMEGKNILNRNAVGHQKARADAAEKRIGELERGLKLAQSLVDDADMGPRGSPDDEWRIPWTRHAVEVFAEIARILSAPAGESGAKP